MSVWYRRVTECTRRERQDAPGSPARMITGSEWSGARGSSGDKILTGGLLNQLRGGEAAAMLPDILPQPVEQGAEIAFLNIAI